VHHGKKKVMRLLHNQKVYLKRFRSQLFVTKTKDKMSQNRAWQAISAGKPPVGAYTPAIRAGEFLYLSGQVPLDADTGQLMGGDVVTQTHAVLDRIERLLAVAGAQLTDVVSVTAYLADIEDWDAFNEAYRTRFAQPYPARTTVGAGLHGFLVEISVIAYLPR
jgi:2-iminobutanoate/2-iminopropanoate deaminase